MSRFHILAIAGLMAALSGAHLGLAQTSSVANLTIESGNGQVACPCASTAFQQLQTFQPISVLATDANGNPVSGATVNWAVTAIVGGQPMAVASPSSVTNTNGIATVTFSQPDLLNIYTSALIPYLQSTIQATSNNSSVTFYETETLVNSQDVPYIQAGTPTFQGSQLTPTSTITGNAGQPVSSPILVQVGGAEFYNDGIPNVAVTIQNEQASPTITCANSTPSLGVGTVLSNAQGLATCNPVLTGSGTGSFYVLVGGVPTSDISTSYYLQAFPNYGGPGSTGFTVTSIPGAPAAMHVVSGNYQTGLIGQQLNPLVAELTDANGNPVQGQSVKWSVTPATGAVLYVTSQVTDNSGQVSATPELGSGAAGGATATVSLVSNPAISTSFSLALTGSSVPTETLTIFSGNNQTAQVGTAFAQSLQVQVLSSGSPVNGASVQFQASSLVSLPNGSTAITNSSGVASIAVAAGSTAGSATVTATVGTLSQTFNLTVAAATGPTASSISIVSGNSQSAMVGTAFAQPLVVQVNSTSGPVAGIVVSFSQTGSLTLSSGAATTNASGQASITVTAGSIVGSASVTAAISGGYQQTFTLTVNPSGPTLTASSFLNGASRQVGYISPCGLAIISAPGLAPNGVSSYTAPQVLGRMPKTVNGLSVTFSGVPAPILSVYMGATNPEVLLQVPCEVTPGSSVPVVVNVSGGGTAKISIPVMTVSPGIFLNVNSDGVSRAVAVRQDGSFADVGGTDQYDPDNPVRQGEAVFFYLTGLGTTAPAAIATDAVESPNAFVDNVPPTVAGTVQAGIVGGPSMTVVSARQAAGLIGVYEVQVDIPSTATVGNSVPISFSLVPAGTSSSTPGVPAQTAIVAVGQ